MSRTGKRRRPTSVPQPTKARAPSLAETTPYLRPSEPGIGEEIGEKFGPYIVYEQLGVGGMAYVNRAELVGEGGLRKPVALKRLQSNCAEDPEFVAAFVHEAQLAAKLRHPNIAQAYDLGKIDGTYYIAMELVPGPTLAQLMQQSHAGGGAIPLAIVLEILIQLCDALDHAHELCDDNGRPLDLVHRDVSPMNVIVSRSGAVKLIDFGIAKARSARRDTEAGIIKGKHAYIAPEYTYGQLDRRADLFGLGVVAHELLTGRRLFAGETDFDTIRNVRSLPIPPPSRYAYDISPQLDAIVLKALARDPDERWQTAGAMRTALTDERNRLGIVVTGRQIRDWAEWAFHQTPRRDSSVDRMLHGLDPSMSLSAIDLSYCSIEVECPPKPSDEVSTSMVTAIAPRASTLVGTSVVTALRPAAAAAAMLPPKPVAPRAPTLVGTQPVKLLRKKADLAISHADTVPAPHVRRPTTSSPAPHVRGPTPPTTSSPAPHLRPPTPASPAPHVRRPTPASPAPHVHRPTMPPPAQRAQAAIPATPDPLPPPPRAPSPRPIMTAEAAGLVVAAGHVTAAQPTPRRVVSVIVSSPPAKRRVPAWRPPTRWARPPRKRSLAPVLLLAVIGLGVWLALAGWIDIDRWREIIATYVD